MFKKVALLLSITTLLTACGGGGSSSSSNYPSQDDPVAEKSYDLYSYLTRAKPTDEAYLQREFYLKKFYYEDGTAAWFNVFGVSTSEPLTDEEKESAFNSLKTTKIMMRIGHEQTLEQTTTKFTPYYSLENGPYFIGDHDSVELHRIDDATTITQNRETRFNAQLDDFTILSKYN